MDRYVNKTFGIHISRVKTRLTTHYGVCGLFHGLKVLFCCVQNFQEEMALQPDAAQWMGWSLEQVAHMLGPRFPGQHIWVVRASTMYLNKFSCYHNFVESNMFGAPEHSFYSRDTGAFHHLR